MAECSSLGSRRFEREDNCPTYGYQNRARRAHLFRHFLRRVPEEIFISPWFHLLLLAGHLATLYYCLKNWQQLLGSYAKLRRVSVPYCCQLLVLPLFMSNFIGVMFARSLHYQFYVWYYHSLHYLAWTTPYPVKIRLLILGVIELCWNTYPSTHLSSLALHASHCLLLGGLLVHTARRWFFQSVPAVC